jgi:hypothetical protein
MLTISQTVLLAFKEMIGAGISYGMGRSIYQTRGFLDEAGEETGYSTMFKSEFKRFNALKEQIQKCTIKGVQLSLDAFYNKLSLKETPPEWLKAVSRFGIPHTTVDSSVKMWDKTDAKYRSDMEVKTALSKGLFLEGEAAKILCDRGYGKYLGVTVENDITLGNKLAYDLWVREIITEKYAESGKGRRMFSAHMFAPVGNGKMLKLEVTNTATEVVTENFTGFNEYISPAMTYFENELGGKVVVSGLTLEGNLSKALFNYRRQRLLQSLIVKCGGDFAFSKDAPGVWVIENDAKSDLDDFYGVLTLINLTADDQEKIKIRLPEKWRDGTVTALGLDGEWERVDFVKTADGVIINKGLKYLYPEYIKVVK